MKIELVINGKEIETNDFVEEIIHNTVLGMVKSLRGVDKVKTLSLKINDGGKS